MTFGEKLLTLRKQSGLSQEQLAEKLSVSRQAVSRWENEGILPDCGNLLELSRLFGVSTDYLLNDGYRSDGDLPAVRSTRERLEAERERQGVLPVVLCAAASLGDILFVEAYLRSGHVPAGEVPGLRRRYYRLGVWFFAWFPVGWLWQWALRCWPRPVNGLTAAAASAAVCLAACCGVWWLLRPRE